MSLEVVFASTVRVLQTLEGDYIDDGDATVTIDQLSESATYTASSTVPVTKHAAFQKTMSAGAGTIDLTAMPGLTAEETVNGTGLKVQLAKFRSLSTNANVITITEGASNGYALLGASFSFKLLPGQSATYQLTDAAPDVAGADKTIDIAGTGSQILEVQLVMG